MGKSWGNPKKIHTEKAITGDDVFWPPSMEVNWIVKASLCLGLSLQSTKLPSTLVLRLSKMDDLLYCGYTDNSLETLSTKHLDLLLSYKIGVKQNSSSDWKEKILYICFLSCPLFYFYHYIYSIGNAKQRGQCQVLLSCSLLTSVFWLEWWSASGNLNCYANTAITSFLHAEYLTQLC